MYKNVFVCFTKKYLLSYFDNQFIIKKINQFYAFIYIAHLVFQNFLSSNYILKALWKVQIYVEYGGSYLMKEAIS